MLRDVARLTLSRTEVYVTVGERMEGIATELKEVAVVEMVYLNATCEDMFHAAVPMGLVMRG